MSQGPTIIPVTSQAPQTQDSAWQDGVITNEELYTKLEQVEQQLVSHDHQVVETSEIKPEHLKKKASWKTWAIGVAVFVFMLGTAGSMTKTATGQQVLGVSSSSSVAEVSSLAKVSSSSSLAPQPVVQQESQKIIAPVQPVYTPPVQSVSSAPSSLYFANCTAAKAAGYSNILRDEPGYRAGLDRDNDGIACES